MHGHKIRANHDHTSLRAGRQSSIVRDVRVTSLVSYSSQLIESHHRKIAVNQELTCFGVGGHIRVMLRQPSVRCLLKGHNSVVSDIEFLSFQETALENSSHVSILGSVADDGSVYVWKLIRSGEGENAGIEIADAIRFEHPDFDKGRCYRRIAFRPGPNSIITDNGVGVAMLLLDSEDTDLRVVELVKMNDKMMVRDKFLVAKNEVPIEGDPILESLDAAAWLSETMMVTSRGGHIFLWNTDNTHSTCIARVPREKDSQVTSIIFLQPDILLFEVSHGRELEVWLVGDSAGDGSSFTMQLQQSIRLFGASNSKDVRCTVSMDPSETLLTVSNLHGSSFFVLHFNFHGRAFDAITEFSVKEPVFSLSLAPSQKANSAQKFPVPSGSCTNGEEFNVWCMHPSGVQVAHISSDLCVPKGPVVPDIHPKPVARTVRRKDKKSHGLLTQSPPPSSLGSSSTSSTTDGSLENSKRTGRPTSTVKSTADGDGSSGANSDTKTVSGGGLNKAGHAGSPGLQAKGNTEGARGKLSSLSTHETDSKAGTASDDASKKNVGGASEAFKGDEMADAILSAAKKVIAAFDDVSAQRGANERVKVEKLVETVTETASSNMERFVNSSMKKVLADMLVPGVSEMIADCRAAMKERARIDGQVGQNHFEEVFERAAIESSFSNACKEMERQVSAAVTDSMTAKYESLIRPSVEVINGAAADLTSSVDSLKEELNQFKPETDMEEVGGEAEAEDIRQVIEDQLREDNIDEAFLTALNREDLELVTWLCSKFDSSQFFLDNPLSQVCMMSLAQQLGQGLTDGDDIVWKVDWLKEVALALDPDSEDIQSVSKLEVRELLDKVKELRKDSDLMGQHPGLERELKALYRLVSSHLIGGS